MLLRRLLLISVLIAGAAAPARAELDLPDTADVVLGKAAGLGRRALDALRPGGDDELFEQLVAETPMLRQLAQGVVARARRSIALGPTIGVVGGLPGADGADADVGVTVGLALTTFKVPLVPSFDDIKRALRQRFLAELRGALAAGTVPDEAGRAALARRVWGALVAEVMRVHGTGFRTFERPRFGLSLDVTRLLLEPDWRARTVVWLGVGPASVGLATTVHDIDTAPSMGVDLAVRVSPRRAPRAAVYDLYATVDWSLGEARGRETWLGLRATLDLI